MNSMHGFWVALAKGAKGSWFHPSWWPYWDGGIPFEFTYAPLVPAAMALLSSFRHISPLEAFQYLTVLIYCLAPLTLFGSIWAFTRAPGYSFLAACIYSLTSPSQLLVPDADPTVRNVWAARRLFLADVWDDTPHELALALMPLVIVLIYISFQHRNRFAMIGAIVFISLMTLASTFGVVLTLIVAICLLATQPKEDLTYSVRLTLFIGAFAYAIVLPFLSPSLMKAIRVATAGREGGWGEASWTGLTMTVAGGLLLGHFLDRSAAGRPLKFFSLFAFFVSIVPILDFYLHRKILPQPERYKLEMDLALSILFVFALRRWFSRLPLLVRMALLVVAFALAREQVRAFRTFAAVLKAPRPLTQTVEYRATAWLQRSLPGVRVMLPTSVSQWADSLGDISQFSGSSWSQAYNPAQQHGLMAQYSAGVTSAEAARISLAWLRAFGVGAVGISSPDSAEYWKGFSHPAKFEGVLPLLWREEGLSIYRIPHANMSLAHIIPETALVSRAPKDLNDTAQLEPYVAALEDASTPAIFEWTDRNTAVVRASTRPGEVVSLQISYHPGWHAIVDGRPVRIQRDGVGLSWLAPNCNNPCQIMLRYDGGLEIQTFRYVSAVAVVGVALGLAFTGYARRRSRTWAPATAPRRPPGSERQP